MTDREHLCFGDVDQRAPGVAARPTRACSTYGRSRFDALKIACVCDTSVAGAVLAPNVLPMQDDQHDEDVAAQELQRLARERGEAFLRSLRGREADDVADETDH